MTAHELARILLDGPDLLVFIAEDSDVYSTPTVHVGNAQVGEGWSGALVAEYARPTDPDAVKVVVL